MASPDDHARGAPKTLSPLEALLDPENPRLTEEEQGSTQATLLEIMIDRFKIRELAESIIASGYNSFDPMVGWQHDSSVTVLEGNRRLAALQLLLDPERAPVRARKQWTEISSRLPTPVKKQIEQIVVLVFDNKDDVDVTAYIGFRHVTGPLKWPALEKARFIAKLVKEQDWDYQRIAERLGSYPKHVERHFVAQQLVEQVEAENLPGEENIKNAFGVLLRALQASGVSEFLGITFPGDPKQSISPVPADHLDNLKDFVKWTFGTKDKTRILPDSRRLTDWGDILQSADAVSYLRRSGTPSFERAFFRSGGQAKSLADSLFTAADRLEESVPLVSEHVDDSEVNEAVQQNTRFLTQILKHFPEVAAEYKVEI